MAKVTFDISMSLDGFITAANQTAEEPMGTGGERLHKWAFGEDERDRAVLREGGGGVGAVMCGRKTYDDSIRWWGADGPTGQARLPVIVVTHEAPNDVPEGGVYTFVTGGIEAALEEAKAVATGKNVTIMGGAQLGQQCLHAGLVDEISIHLVPVVFGAGTRLFEDMRDEHLGLETISAVPTPNAIHLRFRVIRRR